MIEIVPNPTGSQLSSLFDCHKDIQEAITAGNIKLLTNRWYLDKTLSHILFMDGIRIVGDIYYQILKPGIARVHIATIKSYRNSKVSKKMVQLAIQELNRRDIFDVIGQIATSNREARIFAKRIGFKELTGSKETLDGVELTTFIMNIKRL